MLFHLDCASKHALVGFSGSLFNAVQNKGIKVTCIIPGYVTHLEVIIGFPILNIAPFEVD